jgi:hypothetical protein
MHMPSLIPLLDRRSEPERVWLPGRSVQDQGVINACFSCAIATAMKARSASVPPLSPAFHFHYAGGGEAVNGLTPDQALAALSRYGVSSFDAHRFADSSQGSCGLTLEGIRCAPLESADRDGAMRRMEPAPKLENNGYVEVVSGPFTSAMKTFLRDGTAVVAILFPNPAYWRMWHEKYPQMPRVSQLSNADGPFDDAHVVCIIGLDELISCFVVQDSRGTGFGEGGQWLLPFDFADSTLLYRVYGFYSSGI